MTPFSMPMPPIDADLETILAKSEPIDRPESLAAHTWHVLSRMADQRCLRPRLAEETGSPRLWHWLYWGTFLHDFGKVADGFQDMLRGKARRWGFRHEALSLAFVDWLFPDDHPDRLPVIAMIACHHRDAAVITGQYWYNRRDPDEDSAARLIAQVSDANVLRLHRWLTQYGWSWAEALGFAQDIERPEFPSPETALARITPRAIHRAVRDLKHYTEPLRFADDAAPALTGALLRGLILTADHAGSAHSAPFCPAPLERTHIIESLRSRVLFPHQKEADNAPQGSALLISPTSSGKTEAALLWLARQQQHDGLPAPRIFYLLPYQASINAAYRRLKHVFQGDDTVGLQHSRMMQVLYAQALADSHDDDSAAAHARHQAELTRLLRFPVTVMSPYQLLKVPYQLKGFEALLAHFYGGRFILDEIHAYDPKRLALFVAVIEFLRQYCHARFFIMTATLPPPVRSALQAALPDLHAITADTETFARFQRHRVHVLAGDLLAPETVARIVSDATDKSILICCNTVKRAFDVHAVITDALRTRYPDMDCEVILLHSRFNGRDRERKEARILARTGVGSAHRGRTIVVATQVVEVSLNIDLDTLYTEAAPLEALLQRFGRVNRARGAGTPLADVHVMREQPDSVRHIYAPDLITATLECLNEADGTAIDESLVGTWLQKVYTGEALSRWQDTYDESLSTFRQTVMGSLRPFNNSGLDNLFFEMFDGVDVLPVMHLNAYETLFREGKYLEAASWLVPVAWRDYKRLEGMGKAWRDRPTERSSRDIYVVEAAYSAESGLDLYGTYSGGTANRLPRTPLDDYDVPTEAD